MTKFIEVITTFDNVNEARKMAQMVIENRLGACCSVQGVESTFRWKGKIDKVPESMLTIKTSEKLYSELEAFILKNHSYETPQIISLPILAGSAKYLDWLDGETK